MKRRNRIYWAKNPFKNREREREIFYDFGTNKP